jgi:sec-independent protein translocase protein TatA
MFGPGIGAPEILIVVGVIVLLFGGRKLPELARGSGRALRIFKSEVKGLKDDDDDTKPEALETSEAEKKPEQG